MKILAISLLAVIGGVLAGCSTEATAGPTATPTPETFRAIGTIQVPMDISATLPLQDDEPTIGNPCIPKAGYNDVDEGAQVVVSNGKGEKIALGSLEEGTLANGPAGEAFFQSVCQFAFTVDNIPEEGRIYSVHVGNDNRGEQSFSQTDLQSGISLTLG